MAKKKMGGLGKGLDSLFADLSDDTGSKSAPVAEQTKNALED